MGRYDVLADAAYDAMTFSVETTDLDDDERQTIHQMAMAAVIAVAPMVEAECEAAAADWKAETLAEISSLEDRIRELEWDRDHSGPPELTVIPGGKS